MGSRLERRDPTLETGRGLVSAATGHGFPLPFLLKGPAVELPEQSADAKPSDRHITDRHGTDMRRKLSSVGDRLLCRQWRHRAIPALLASLLAFLLTPGVSQAQDWELIVCADPNAPPFSQRDETGFENQIAYILADELGATLTFFWIPQARTLMSERFRIGACDLIIGLPESSAGTLSTLTYYRSPYVFVYRADEDYDIFTFDDPILRDLRLGVEPTNSPATLALERRGLGANIVLEVDFVVRNVVDPVIAAVAAGEIDVAIMWGPTAGYHAQQSTVELIVMPVPLFEPPFIPMFINMVIGVRLGDESFRDLLDIAIVNRWDDIQAVLEELDIPRMPLVPPIITLELP